MDGNVGWAGGMEGRGRCFAEEAAQCRILTEKRCEGCRFYKTGAQLDEERRRCARRLNGMGLRTWAALKYGGYGGRT